VKAGDLVMPRHERHSRLGRGLIMSVDGRYCWVWFEGWRENYKWFELKDLEVVSESGGLGKDEV